MSHKRRSWWSSFEPVKKTTSIEISKGWQGGGGQEENLGKVKKHSDWFRRQLQWTFWKTFLLKSKYFVQDLFYCHCCLVWEVHVDTWEEGGTERQSGNIFTGWLLPQTIVQFRNTKWFSVHFQIIYNAWHSELRKTSGTIEDKTFCNVFFYWKRFDFFRFFETDNW